jgi:hypothetical protein
MATDAPVLTDRERSVLERLAQRVVDLRLEVPAVLTIESARPLALVAAQAMVFFEPFAQALFRLEDYRTWTGLVERREVLELLTRMIETRADDERGRRRAARKAAAPTPRP